MVKARFQAEIESLAKLIGTTQRTFFRLGFGFARQRNGAHNMHAVLSIPAVTGAWLHEGGGEITWPKAARAST